MSEPSDLHDDLRDHLADQALREVLSGRRPPDLSAAILAAAASDAAVDDASSAVALNAAGSAVSANAPAPLTGGLTPPARLSTQRRWRTRLLYALAASLLVAVGFGAGAVTVQQLAARSTDGSGVEFESLVSLITSTITPDAWEEVDGPSVEADKESGERDIAYTVTKPQPGANRGSKDIAYSVGKPVYEAKSSSSTGETPSDREARHKGVVEMLAEVERSHVPVADEPPVGYPDPDTWRQLTARRKAAREATDQVVTQENLAQMVDEYNTLIDERRYAEAEVLSKQAAQVAPDEPVVKQILAQSMMIRSLNNQMDIRDREEGAAVRALESVDEASIPFDDRSPIAFPDAKKWSELTKTRAMLRNREKRSGSEAARPVDEAQSLSTSGEALGDIADAEAQGTDPVKLAVTPRVILQEEEEKLLEELVSEVDKLELAKNPEFADQGRGPGESGDRYSRIVENQFLAVLDNPLSTFSIDVDTASYAKTRRYLTQEGTLPPPDAVRIEEFVNYFEYDYAPPADDTPFAAHVEVAACPWRPEHRLVRVGLKGREIAAERRPTSNLVFLLDVSGSMEPEDKLPRVRRSMRMLVDQLGENDRVAIVVYASAEGLVLPSTPGAQRDTIQAALEQLQAGGSTNGGAGIRLAYDVAAQNFITGGVNRVVLCTDGDFNVGTTSDAELERLIEERAKAGVFLTVLGFGMGNHNDAMLEKLADKGNGNYGYIDTEEEARKLLVDQLSGTLVTIAKDVKLQLEFNPAQVAAWRLIGYEDRVLKAEDFRDDRKDAGEIGAGHTVTALYEVVPAGRPAETQAVDPLKYQRNNALSDAAASGELLTLKVRYKQPDGQVSTQPLDFPVKDAGQGFGQASGDFKFAAAVAGCGMLLRGSQYKGNLTYDAVLEIAQESIGADPHGYRAGFLNLVRKAKELANADR